MLCKLLIDDLICAADVGKRLFKMNHKGIAVELVSHRIGNDLAVYSNQSAYQTFFKEVIKRCSQRGFFLEQSAAQRHLVLAAPLLVHLPAFIDVFAGDVLEFPVRIGVLECIEMVFLAVQLFAFELN
ncbi:unknown [Clostridium sp. CAG:242]|nr:unknown [Clostridium sp. CAG:242]